MSSPWERIGASRSEVDRCGETLRDLTAKGLSRGPIERAALDLLDAFRAEFTAPLTKVVMGLRSAVQTEGAPVLVAQRLKRQPRIVGKLVRFPRMELSRMQDIGGCRAIVPDVRTVDGVLKRIVRQKSEVLHVDDYNLKPKPSGYRAVHVIVRRDMTLIEIQLRTPWQQQWATLVEDIDGALRLTLKDEEGPEELLGYLRSLAYAQWEQYGLGTLSARARRRFLAAQTGAEAWLRSRGASQ
jgi:hypothetical protein